MAEKSGCARIAVALLCALFCAAITLYGVRLFMEEGCFEVYTSLLLALIAFVGCFWAFARIKNEPAPVPSAPPPVPIRYGYV
jgi:hypothetical protein